MDIAPASAPLPDPEPTLPQSGGAPRPGQQRNGKGAGRPPKKGQHKCPGCAKYFTGDQYPIGSKYCFPCKRIKDALYKSAKRSNEQEWLAKLLNSEGRTKKEFDRYRSLEGVQSCACSLFLVQCLLLAMLCVCESQRPPVVTS